MAARRARGFGLVEVVVTVSVFALLLAVALPGAVDMVRNTQIRTLGESITNGVQKARAEALKRNRNVTFWLVTPAVGTPDASCALSSGSASWVVSLDNPADRCDRDPSDTTAPRIIEKFGNSYANITAAALGTDGTTVTSSITFNGFGLPVATGTPIGRINLTHVESGVRNLRVEISSSGGVRLCDRNVAAPDPRACLQATP